MYKAMLLFMAGMLMLACQKPESSQTETSQKAKGTVSKESLKTQDDKLNYSVGVEIGKNIKRNGLSLNEAIFMKGIADGMSESEPLLSDEEMMKVKRDHSTAQREKRKKDREEAGKKNKEDGAKFLAENAKKEGVVTVESGLQYKILTEGKGPKPVAADRVKVNYKGTLIDGTEFDSSYKRNEPATFPVNRVVKGWTEALQLMPVGSKWQVFIPPDLGYGPQGAGEKIGPESVLIFEMELLEILKEDPNQKQVMLPPHPSTPPPPVAAKPDSKKTEAANKKKTPKP